MAGVGSWEGRVARPETADQVAEAVREAAPGGSLRARGGGTKLAWGNSVPPADLEISTEGVDRILAHNAGDLTAVVEAGVRLAEAQAAFAEAGQMLALDPPLGDDERATVGGVVATGDAGPLRNRYGAPRDLLLGLRAVLADGSVVHAGGTVIKNVAGYDLAKLFSGSFGTLGIVVEVAVRLHPIPKVRATAVGRTGRSDVLERAALDLAAAPLGPEAVDVAWRGGEGSLLVRCTARSSVDAAATLMAAAGLDAGVEEDDGALWEGQRAGQRSAGGVIVRVSGLPADLARTIGAAERAGGSLVGRAGLGVSWIRLADGAPEYLAARAEALRRDLTPRRCLVLDAPAAVRERVSVWGPLDPAEERLLARVKREFDPEGVWAPGLAPGGR